MSLDHSNDYSHAGPGAKRRRERLIPDSIPRKVATKGKYQPNLKPKAAEEEPFKTTAKGIKSKVTLLSLQSDSMREICRRLDREGYGGSTKVLVSYVRNATLQVLDVMMQEGLITQKALDEYREQSDANYQARFSRRQEAG
jgi:hypothetical protein